MIQWSISRRSGLALLGFALCVVALVGLAAQPALAAPVYVSVFGSDGVGDGSPGNPYRSVQYAIDQAASGDDIHVGIGTFEETATVGDILMKDGVSLYGAGALATTLKGIGTERVISAVNVGSSTTISGFSITSGNTTESGGGIYCSNSSPTITRNIIRENKASNGGGIFCDQNSSPNIFGNTITLNTASNDTTAGLEPDAAVWGGGGIGCLNSSPTITKNTITDNKAPNWVGGAINMFDSSPIITQNTITGNTADVWGGGISCDGDSSSVITSNTITGNKLAEGANRGGGGIYCGRTSTVTIRGNTISQNEGVVGGGILDEFAASTIASNTISNNKGSTGGGVFCYQSSSTITSNTITGNEAVLYAGGGINCSSASVTITGNTITENVANNYAGGGINCDFSSVVIDKNTIARNTAVDFGGGGISLNNSSPTIVNNLITGNTASNYGGGGIYSGQDSAPTIINNTITGNEGDGGGGIYAQDPSPTPAISNCIIWENGDDLLGCTATYSDIKNASDAAGLGNISLDPGFVGAAADFKSGDFHLLVTSPCIDVATATAAPAFDKDGVARPVDLGFDMGAYEYPPDNPVAFIDSVTPSSITSGQAVAFVGHGTDPDHAITGYQWTSSIDGTLSVAATFSNSTLSAGTHTISFKVQCSNGKWSPEVTTTLVVAPDLVLAFIDSVTPSSTTSGGPVAFVGHGTDPDHTITGYLWKSSIDSTLSTAAAFSTSALSIGTHTITFKVQCSNGAWSPDVSTTVVVNPPLPPNFKPVYRFYNSKAGVHFYTASEVERQNVMDTLSDTYHYEGVAYTINTANPANSQPLYRFYHMSMGVHFYTASETEKQNVIDNLLAIYRFEGVAYNVCTSPPAGSTTVWRFFNKKTGTHFYTASEDEKNKTIALLGATYTFEGPAFFLAP